MSGGALHRIARGRVARSLAVAVVVVVASFHGAADVEALEPGARSPWADGLSGPIDWAHDPDIAFEDGTWYVFSTYPRIRIRSSQDLVRWEDEGLVFPDGWPAWLSALFGDGDQNIWAPDLERIDGVWHLTYSRAVFGTQDAAIGVATSPTLDPDDPDYGWTDHGMIARSTAGSGGITAIDPNLVLDEAGAPWLVWGSFFGGIAIAPYDADAKRLVPGVEPTLLAKRARWYDGIEGPQVVHRDGWWWLTTSWGFCCQAERSYYAMRIGRSRTLAGPYVDLAGTPLLEGGGTLLIGSHGDQHGIGHGSLFESPAGWAMVHHYYDLGNRGRETLGLTPLIDLDGWPLAIDPDVVVAPDPRALVAGTWTVDRYRENVDPPAFPPVAPATLELGLRADGSVVGGGRWRVDGSVVRVEADRLVASDGGRGAHRFTLVIDEGGALALGRDQATDAIRAVRIGPPPGADPTSTTQPPGSGGAPGPTPPAPVPATPVAGAPSYAG